MRHWIKRWESITRGRTEADEHVAERRTGEVSGKYEALYKYLENRYANVVVLTFGEIEDLLGFALPVLARTRQEWWTITDPNAAKPPYSDAWMLAGRTARPNLSAKNVIFERALTRRPALH